MTGDPVRRSVRVLTLAAMLFLTGLAGHLAAGGHKPTAPALLLLFVLTLAVVTQFAGAALSPTRIVVLLVGGQGLLHALLQSLNGSTVTGTNPVYDAVTDMAGVSTTTSSHHITHFGAAVSHDGTMSFISGAQVVMLLAHVAAVLVVGMWLALGERAVWALLAFTVRPVVYGWRRVIGVARRVIGAAGIRFRRPQPDWVPQKSIRSCVWAAAVVSRRGPPRCCLV